MPPLSIQEDVVVIIGAIGAGKSTFIQYAAGPREGTIGRGLKPYTPSIRTIKITHPTGSYSVAFVDTPGFDDTYKSEAEILTMIAGCFDKSHKRKINLTTIIYLHKISDNRMNGPVLKNLHVLPNLLGSKAMPNVVIATTMWSQVSQEEGIAREMALKSKFWNGMLAEGCRIERFTDTHISAWNIIDGPGNDLVVVMGTTGSGKSNFIATASGKGQATVRHDMKTTTSSIQTVKAIHPKSGRSVVFIDTPGFDIPDKSDTETLKEIFDWLVENKRKASLISIVYLHRIPNPRIAKMQQNLKYFATLYGQDAMANVTVATWSEVQTEKGAKWEAELKAEFSKDHLTSGCKIERFEDTYDSAWNIVGTNPGTSFQPQPGLDEPADPEVAPRDQLPKWVIELLKRAIRRYRMRRT